MGHDFGHESLLGFGVIFVDVRDEELYLTLLVATQDLYSLRSSANDTRKLGGRMQSLKLGLQRRFIAG